MPQPYNEHRVQRNIRRRGNDHERHGCRRIAQPALQRADQVISKVNTVPANTVYRYRFASGIAAAGVCTSRNICGTNKSPSTVITAAINAYSATLVWAASCACFYIARTQQAADDHQHPPADMPDRVMIITFRIGPHTETAAGLSVPVNRPTNSMSTAL